MLRLHILTHIVKKYHNGKFNIDFICEARKIDRLIIE